MFDYYFCFLVFLSLSFGRKNEWNQFLKDVFVWNNQSNGWFHHSLYFHVWQLLNFILLFWWGVPCVSSCRSVQFIILHKLNQLTRLQKFNIHKFAFTNFVLFSAVFLERGRKMNSRTSTHTLIQNTHTHPHRAYRNVEYTGKLLQRKATLYFNYCFSVCILPPRCLSLALTHFPFLAVPFDRNGMEESEREGEREREQPTSFRIIMIDFKLC